MRPANPVRRAFERGSVLIIVLWITFGLVAVTLYFANSTGFELRASDNRVCALAAEQAIEAGARYAAYVLANHGTNGVLPDYTTYYREAVPVGDAHFWFIGRNYDSQTPLTQPFFALVDEASKLNLNSANTNMLDLLPNMTQELSDYIIQWRSTNSTGSQTYAALHPPYLCKSTNFETVDELRLVYGASRELLEGEDSNRNGVLDPDEYDQDRNNLADPGLLEYFTVYSREPNLRPDGSQKFSLRNLNTDQLTSLLQTNFDASRASAIRARLGNTTTFASPLQFFMRSGMTADEFGVIADNLTVASGTYIVGRVNVTTASPAVLCCLPGITTDLALQLVSYRDANLDRITNSIAWVVEAIGQNNDSVLQTLAAGDYITVKSYQFTADIAAVGPYGRGYRRVKYIFDLSNGTPTILYRQDLSHLGWALGREVRQTWLVAKGATR
ncbi:MAG: general secretion pathway protein GspK [Verrucomicrobia bacterium]|nr:general secretion pathway protein GspK [Verrucomicrobiota bacterium]